MTDNKTSSSSLRDSLKQELTDLDARSLRRSLHALPATGKHVKRGDRELLNLAGNDYLALAQHETLKRAAIDAIQTHGCGSAASRLVTGHLEAHEQIEARFADFKHAEAALLLPTGYMANLAVLTTLPQSRDTILIDKLTHASLIDAARASEAEVRTFRHLDYNHLEDRLAKARSKHAQQIFIVTDSVFSMDGDVADLAAICDLAARYQALTVVDEAHATGLLGPNGEGLIAEQQVVGKIDVAISTASKALGGLGGIITADRVIIDTLINRARPFIYTTAVPPAQIATLAAALDVVRDEPHRRERVIAMSQKLRNALAAQGWALPQTQPATPIVPLTVGSAQRAIELSEHLQNQGILGVAIRPPTVAPGSSRVRVSLRADLDDADLDRLMAAANAFDR